MEIFGGFMVMMSILSFFMAVVWLVMPFVVFAIKGKLDRTQETLERVETRLAAIESQLGEISGNMKNGTADSAENQPGAPVNDASGF